MSRGLHSFHLASIGSLAAVGALALPAPSVAGLRHMECLAGMRLGAPVFSPARLQLDRLAVFAEWEDECALEGFLTRQPLGRRLARGWHVRLRFVRRWGSVSEQAHLPEEAERTDLDAPAVALTLARMRLPQLPRFIRWGRPVETLVRDHPGATLAIAALRPPRTVSTFSVWSSAREMTGMVAGRGGGERPARHAEAMVERERRDFHHEFTTLRFRPLSEHGSWDGRSDYVPAHPRVEG